MTANDPNPYCCCEPNVIVVIETERIDVRTKLKRKIAKCPNCGKVKEIMNEDKIMA